MAIRILRNEQANSIQFEGTTFPVYWNSCLSAEISATDANNVNVINDIESENQPTRKEEISNEPYTSFVDKDGNGFADAQACIDYINEKANVTGLTGDGIDLSLQTICFTLDETNTSIMMDNGYAFGVNTIKAVPENGLIKIVSNNTDGTITHFYDLDHTLTCVNGNSVSGGLNDVINTLNELFTVGAFQAVVIADPYSTMIADVNGVNTTTSYVGYGIDPIGNDVYGSTNSNSQNGYKTTETIDQAGEYFTFDIRVEGTIGFGLVHSQASYDAGYWSGSSAYADPTSFGVGNNAHYGFQFSHWFHPTPNGSWTNYGANTSYSMRAGWSNFNGTTEQADWIAGNPIKVRVGIDTNGFISIETLRNGTDWEVHARTSYPIQDGAEFHLGIKTNDTNVRVYSLPKVHLLEPAAPTMYFRYIESPDGNFQYPLFATEEEANYYDTENGGAGASVSNVYPDEPTFATWYAPVNGFTNNGTAAPTSAILFDSNPINWTEITSLTNADLAPVAFTDNTVTVDELSAVNIQLHPTGADFITSIVDTDNSGLHIDVNGIHLNGTAPEVLQDYDANPTDTYTIEVVRTNSYGSSSGTLTLIVTNLTAPITAISGFNHVAGTTAMIDSDTMDDGSVVHINNQIADAERFVIEKAYVETNILPNLNAANDMYIIGLENIGADFSTVELSDFDAAIVWEYVDANSHRFTFYRDGVVAQTGGSSPSDIDVVINSSTQAYYDYAIEIDGTSAWLIACNVNSIMNEPSPNDGGSFTHTYEVTNIEDTPPSKIHMAALNTIGDISATDISTITTPTAPVGTTTPYNYALDFSGTAEHLKQVNTHYGYNPIMMSGWSNIVAAPTAGQTVSAGHPWATAVVFKIDGHSSNQHIWNCGEGAGSTDDNIYLRVDANRNIYFGWGRDGSRNELFFGSLDTTTWYGCYIGFNGTRLSGANATAANLADVFDVRLYSDVTNWQSASAPNSSTPTLWGLSQSTTGGGMDREFTGSTTIGGRASNRSFHGKVASMLITTLNNNVAMPDTTEIELMVTNPIKWVEDYKIGNTFKRPNFSTTDGTNFQLNNFASSYATQLILNGDGALDNYSNHVRNYINPSDQNFTRYQLNSMVSNDFENVNINGLT